MSKSVGKRYPYKKRKERMGSSGSKRVGSPEAPIGEKPKAVRVWLLGGFRVDVGSRAITQDVWHLRNSAALVKLLALAPSHRLHREQAMELLWPNAGRKAASNSLRSTLHVARNVLDLATGAQYLASEGESLVLYPGGDLWVDVDAFEETASAARRSRQPAAFRAALELYAEDLLPEDRYEEWAEGRRDELRHLYLTLLLQLAEVYEERREHEMAIEVLRKATAKEPTFEEAHLGLMRLHALSGRSEQAVAQFERLRDNLSRRRGTQPSASSRRLRDEIAAGDFPPPLPLPTSSPQAGSLGTAKHNLLAPRTSFVGREREIVEVRRMLAMTRLLTLTGAGGSGKTRLALEMARALIGIYPDGVWLVELAPLTEGALVPHVVAETLGMHEQPNRKLTDTLVDALKTKQILLVLDNCEHLVEACARLVDTLLASCPHLRVLATSREFLGVAGEAVWQVSSLSVPHTDRLPAAGELTRYDAVRLFVDRARLRLPDFDLTSANASAVAEVCGNLEGMPLAIELATARMGALAVEEVAQRLDDSLRLLTAGPRTVAPRQRTMRATLEWSHGLLSEPEKKLFRGLSVFAGGWTLEAAEAVCSGGAIEEGDVLDLVSRLVDKSLVVAETTGEGWVRYRMLEPIRQYAQERLEESNGIETIRPRHAEFFLALAEEAKPELRGLQQEVWLRRLEIEHDNLRTALSWTLEQGEAELSLRFSATLGEFWYMRGHLSEGRRWLETALAKGDAPSVVRVRALAKASWIAMEQADLERATALGEEGLKLARKLRDEEGTAAALLNLGMPVMARGDLERSTALLEEGLPLFRELGDQWGLTRSLLCLGFGAMFQGDDERAKALVEESLEVSRESGDVWSSGMALNQMAVMALLREDYGRVEALCKESLELSRRSGMDHLFAIALHTSAALAGSRGQPLRSARLWGAAEALREAMGTVFTPLELQTYGPYIAAARAQVEEVTWEAAWQMGRAMSMEEAMDYVLAEGEEHADTTALTQKWTPIPAQTTPLTRRELEVAALVARGLTNRQIASELSISEHTVATHVGKTLRKLGMSSRSQLAVWAAEQHDPPSVNSD